MRWLLTILALFAALPAAAQKRIALTFDDAPRARGAFMTPDERSARLIAALKAARVKGAAFFVNPGNLEKPDGAGGDARIAAYAAAGHVVANHGFSHLPLSRTGIDAYVAEIDRTEAWLKGRAGYRPWYRFPFLDEGRADKAKRDAARAALDARGLVNGHVTIDGSDWNIERLTIEAARAGKKIDMAALRDLYVETMVGAAEHYDALARKTLGRSPMHTILLHETDIAALYIADLAKALRKKGWEIVTADKAFADPLSKAQPDTPAAQGVLIERLAAEKAVPGPHAYERNDIPLAGRLFAARVLHEKAP